MNDRDDLRRYLQARLRELEARPELCTQSIAAYRATLVDIDNAGDLFALARADSLDRFINLAALYDRLGDERRAYANRIRFDAAHRAQDHRDLVERLTHANEHAVDLETRSARIYAIVDELLDCVVPLATGTPKDRRDAAAKVARLVADAHAIDKAFTLKSLRTDRALRRRIPWDDAGVDDVVHILSSPPRGAR